MPFFYKNICGSSSDAQNLSNIVNRICPSFSGESINEFTSSNVTYDADGSKSVSKASYDGVDVTQELSIIENSATGRDDVVKIMCNIDGNIYLYTNISVNSGSVLFLNLSDGSFFINIDLDNDGEIDTTVTPTINPGVIQDDEKSPEITVESCNAGISNSNTINPNIVITNNSDKPLKMSDITINYVFNADNKENLEYHCDWLAVDNQYLGNTSVCEFVNDDYGNTYAKIKFNTDVELQPNKQFVIHFRLNAADWSNWDTSNDYSMGTEQLLPNDKIIVFYNEQLISGVQP